MTVIKNYEYIWTASLLKCPHCMKELNYSTTADTFKESLKLMFVEYKSHKCKEYSTPRKIAISIKRVGLLSPEFKSKTFRYDKAVVMI